MKVNVRNPMIKYSIIVPVKNVNDYIVKHGPGDYGVVKTDIFAKTYDKSKEGK